MGAESSPSSAGVYMSRLLVLGLCSIVSSLIAAETAQHRLLNPIDVPAAVGFGGWQVDGFAAQATNDAKLGAAAVTVSAKARQGGGKGGLTVSDAPLAAASFFASFGGVIASSSPTTISVGTSIVAHVGMESGRAIIASNPPIT